MNELRDEINKIDRQILGLLKKRFEVAKKVAAFKKKKNLPIYQAQREKEILSSLDNRCRNIYKVILETSCYSQVKYKIDKHIVLIGLPASGKSTIAKKLGKLLSIPVCEMDKELQSKKTLETQGEEAFRKKEAEFLKSLCDKPQMIISTGGGSVLSGDAMAKLKEKSIFFYINRDLKDIKKFLNVKKRPLFKTKTLEQIYQERKHLYEKFADYAVKNEKQILNILIRKEK